jgi:excinuclease ABC subunit B
VYERDYATPAATGEALHHFRTQAELDQHIAARQQEMREAARNLDFEKAAAIRDDIKRLRNPELGLPWPARRA